MNYDPFDSEPKELMSESLQDAFPSAKQDINDLENIFILASLSFEDGSMLTGNILGIEFGQNPKIDIKILTQKVFKFIGNILSSQKRIKSVYLTHADEIVELSGPFKINNLKIVEMDYENRACVLAIDLFKD